MSQNLPEENLIRDYLLGQLLDNVQDVVEERLLTDSQFLQTARMIEGELLDDYVMELLSESDRLKVESRLLTTAEQRRRLQLIKLLRLKSNALPKNERLTLLSHFDRRLQIALAA